MPYAVQLEFLKLIPALKEAHVLRPGYAIEYSFFDPTQIPPHPRKTKLVRNLYFAGQVNGTTGYEEAAGQGLVAAINAHLRAMGQEENPFVLGRRSIHWRAY